jgi:hypothetical protein
LGIGNEGGNRSTGQEFLCQLNNIELLNSTVTGTPETKVLRDISWQQSQAQISFERNWVTSTSRDNISESGTIIPGLRSGTNGSWSQKGFRARWDGSYLSGEGDQKSEFVRHRSEFSQQLGKRIRIGLPG